jgi:hypothetical protein
MENFYEKTEYSFEDINSLILNEVEESINLEFKDGRALDKSDKKKVEISKDISAFANSDGGIIIYGITEENHKANGFSFVNGNEYTKEWLEQIINSLIQRRIPDILIFPIRRKGNLHETIYLIKIPASVEAPHLNKDKRFYKRYNFESVQMEEYEIRRLYGRKIKSKLSLQSWSFAAIESNSDDTFKFKIEVGIINDGDITESNYKVNFYFNNYNANLKASWPQNNSHYNYTVMENKRIKISASSITPIFPNETINAFRIELEVSKDVFFEAIKDVKIEIRLFYENGDDILETTLDEMSKNFAKLLLDNEEE